jgi:hypothetical protein
MSFEGRDILSTEDLTKEEILEIMGVTAKMEDLFGFGKPKKPDNFWEEWQPKRHQN